MTAGVPLDRLAGALGRYHGPQRLHAEPRVVGVAAGAVAVRAGPQVLALEIVGGDDPHRLAAAAGRRCWRWQPDCVFAGGAVVADLLRLSGFSPVVFHDLRARAYRGDRRTRREELLDELLRWLDGEGALPADPATLALLHNGMPQPIADALALTFAAPVAARPRTEADRGLWLRPGAGR